MQKLILENASNTLIEQARRMAAAMNVETEVSDVDFTYDESPEGRWTQLVLASQGTRLWSNTANSNSPLYAGKLPEEGDDRVMKLVILDLAYAKQSFDFFKKFGVTYIGRINVDPRDIIVVDHKKAADRHDVVLSEDIKNLLASAPATWWGAVGIVSAGNPDKLDAFINTLMDVVPIVFTTGAAAKLKYAGREYVHLGKPTADPRYGIDMREAAYRLSNKLAQQ